jgi:gluconokinase
VSCLHVLVMGVAGSGKTTVATALAGELDVEMIEGDAYHSAVNVEKMRVGIPLTDEDRWPWLLQLAVVLGDRHDLGIGTVLACSALRRSYRDVIRSKIPTEKSFVVYLDVGATTLRDRLATRRGHYMPASLLDSQLATLEPLSEGERGVTVDASRSSGVVIADALASIRTWMEPRAGA